MAAKNRITKAVLYLRRSTDKQETSIEDQRTALVQHAKRQQYKIVGEYVDDGISGDATEKRLEFLRMRDGANSDEFNLVLCWDQDRFGRFDPIEAGYWILPFRNAGVSLETIAQGKIDWNDFAGRITYMVQQEGKHQFLQDLSRNVSRGLAAKAAEGKGTGGNRIPHGYRVEREFDDHGRLVDYYLVVNPEQAEIVRRIFEEFLSPGGSARGVAASLNRDKIPTPGKWASSTTWSDNVVRYILKNRKYMGDFVWGLEGVGAYSTAVTGEVTKRTKGQKATVGKPIVHRDNHPAIISRETFSAAQAKLEINKIHSRPKSYRTYVLCGLLKCGDCGGSMVGVWREKNVEPAPYYHCNRYARGGKSACYCNSIPEAPLVSFLIQQIQQRYCGSAARARLRKAMQHELTASDSVDTLRSLRRDIESLNAKIDKGAERLLEASDAVAATISTKLEELHSRRQCLQDRLQEAEKKRCRRRSDRETIDAAMRKIEHLGTILEGTDRIVLADTLATVVDRIELQFDHEQRGKLTRSTFRHGTVYVQPWFMPQGSDLRTTAHCSSPFGISRPDSRSDVLWDRNRDSS